MDTEPEDSVYEDLVYEEVSEEIVSQVAGSNQEINSIKLKEEKECDIEIIEVRSCENPEKETTFEQQSTCIEKKSDIKENPPANDFENIYENVYTNDCLKEKLDEIKTNVRVLEKTDDKNTKEKSGKRTLFIYVYKEGNNEKIETSKKRKLIDDENKDDPDIKEVFSSMNDERIKANTRLDLFHQPFARKVLQSHLESNNLEEMVDYLSENEHVSFVDSNRICRLCMKTGQNVFIKLFFVDHKPTPLNEKLSSLLGKEKVEEDLLPQQVCLNCSEQVYSRYNFVKQCSEAHEFLHTVLDVFKTKTHVFRKDLYTTMYLKIYEKCYEFETYNLKAGKASRVPPKKLRLLTGQPEYKTSRLPVPPSRERKLLPKITTQQFSCFFCEHSSPAETFNKHMIEKHDCHIQYKCPDCNTTFTSLSLLTKHECSRNNRADNYHNINGDDNSHSDNIDTNVENVPVNRQFLKKTNRQTVHDDHKCSEINGSDDYHDNINGDDNFHHGYSSDNVESVPVNRKFLIKTKQQTVHDECTKIFKSGTSECRSCKSCHRLFNSTFPEINIRAHVLTHLKENDSVVEPEHFNLDEYLDEVPCYYCPFCKNPKKTQSEMKKHLLICRSFVKKFQLEKGKPINRKRNKEKTVCCKTCADNIPYSKKDYGIHVREIHPEQLFKCFLCDTFLLDKISLYRHHKDIHLSSKTGKSPILCEYCSREFTTRRGYQLHVEKTHLSQNPKSKQFSKIRKNAYRPKVITNVEEMQCPLCKKRALFKYGQAGLDFHILKHNSPTGKVACCNREFINFVKYRIHKAGHSRVWRCRKCSLKFKSATYRQDHVCTKNYKETRNETKTCTCKTCDISFDSMKKLRVHQRTVHWDEDETRVVKVPRSNLPEPIACCGTNFYTLVSLKGHQSHHKETPCKKCNDVLNSKLDLKQHMKTRHFEYLKQCNYCMDTFSNSDVLKYHMLKHTQGRLFHCPCGYSFYTHHDMRRHQMEREKRNQSCESATVEKVVATIL